MQDKDELHIEQRIKELGCDVAPRVTPDDVDAAVKDVMYHVFPGTTTTVCCIVLQNGHTVVDMSACADPANFNRDLGEEVAFMKARRQIWELEGYKLRSKLAGTPV